jgi:hypothetical protein
MDIFQKMKAYYDMWKGGQAALSEEPGAGGKIILRVKWALKSRMRSESRHGTMDNLYLQGNGYSVHKKQKIP